MEKQSYNIGHRRCSLCYFIAHIMFPEFDKTGSDDWAVAKDKYLDDYVKSFGWTKKDGEWYCCKCSSKEKK